MNKLLEKLKYLLPAIGAWLGALGGQGVKEWRRVVLPIILAIISVISLRSWFGLFMGTFGASSSVGYGVPSGTDEGSTLGRFWYKITNQNHVLTDVLTRGTVGLMMCTSGIVCPILKENWLMYALGCVLVMIGQTVFSWRGWGEVEIFSQRLLRSDLWNYGFIFTGYLLMII